MPLPPRRPRPDLDEILRSDDVEMLRKAAVTTLSELEAHDESRDDLERELAEVRARLEQAQVELRTQEGELGRLRAVAQEVETLRLERSQAVAELAQVRADLDARVAAEVGAAVNRLKAEHEAAAAAWERQRTTLEERISDLEGRLEDLGTRARVAPRDLASQFAAVLDDLAEGPAPTSEKPYGAALTGLEVEARGIIAAGEEEPSFVSVEGGVKSPEELSTLRMTFRLLPRIPRGTEPAPDG
jgi:predicted  nucleic acid-binding Zn-ribbon protein